MVSFAEMFGEVGADLAVPTPLSVMGIHQYQINDCWVNQKPEYMAWPFPSCKIIDNPLAAMCHYRDSHSTERMPEPKSTAKPAPAGIGYVRAIGDRSKIGV